MPVLCLSIPRRHRRIIIPSCHGSSNCALCHEWHDDGWDDGWDEMWNWGHDDGWWNDGQWHDEWHEHEWPDETAPAKDAQAALSPDEAEHLQEALQAE